MSLLLLLDEKESGLDDSIKGARRRRRKRVIGNYARRKKSLEKGRKKGTNPRAGFGSERGKQNELGEVQTKKK